MADPRDRLKKVIESFNKLQEGARQEQGRERSGQGQRETQTRQTARR